MMNMNLDAIDKPRPSYVTFAVVAEEDRTATQANGHYTSKDIVYAYITPAGSKDRIVRNAEEWMEQLKHQVRENRIPAEWAKAYRDEYEAWKEGRETPLSGTSVKNWPSASPAQVDMLLNLRLRTIEDVAQANEETLRSIGMGARALKQLAIEWLAAAKDTGKVTEEIVSLRMENKAQKELNEQLSATVARMEQQLLALTEKVGGQGKAVQAPRAEAPADAPIEDLIT